MCFLPLAGGLREVKSKLSGVLYEYMLSVLTDRETRLFEKPVSDAQKIIYNDVMKDLTLSYKRAWRNNTNNA